MGLVPDKEAEGSALLLSVGLRTYTRKHLLGEQALTRLPTYSNDFGLLRLQTMSKKPLL